MKLFSRIFVFLLVGIAAAFGEVSPSTVEPALRFRQWRRDDGLPQTSASAIAQTPDGYLWIATYDGLARFDGRRFVTFQNADNPLKDLGKTALLVSRQGELIVTSRQGSVYALHHGTPRLIARFPNRAFERIAEDAEGDFWLMSEQRELVRARDGLVIPPVTDPYRVWSMLGAYYEPASKKVWVLRDQDFGYIEEGRFTSLHFRGENAVRGLGPARDGGMWLVFANRLEHWTNGRAGETIQTGPWSEIATVSGVTETTDGRIAIGTTESGLFIFDRTGNRIHYDRHTGLADDWVMSVFVDREGTLWVGLANQGLAALQRVTFDIMAPPDRWGGRSITNTVVDPNGGFWVGSEGAGYYHFFNGIWDHRLISESNGNQYVWSIAHDSDQHLWLGTWGGGLFEQAGAACIPHPELEAIYQTPAALLNARDGSLWVGSEEGLFRRNNGQLTSYPLHSTIPRTLIPCMVEGLDGAIWFGTNSEGLGRLKDGKLDIFKRADGLPSDHVTALHIDENGDLWIGSDMAGLTRYKNGAFKRVSENDGLRARYINYILDDNRGQWWLSTRDGIVSIKKTSLFRRVNGDDVRLEVRAFTTNDGLPSIECAGSSSLTPEGELLFPTKSGLARTRPENVITNSNPPPLIIESLTVEGRAELIPDSAPLFIKPGSQRYIFSFTAPSFVAPENCVFRYQLQGVDKTWVDAGPDRTATYSFLPPGKYIFRVIGANGHGVWNEKPAETTIILLPFFWQTWWFQVLAYAVSAIVLGLIAFAFARRRWAKQLNVLERQQALERERARIAKDIHDDLGANLTRISLLTQSAQRNLGTSPTETAAHLERISRKAREMTKTMDEIVWAVNPSHDSLDSVATYVAAYSQEFLGAAGISCRWDFPLTLPAWPVTAEIRHNLFLAIKEALNNVVCHAQASRVDLALRVSAGGFELSVTDNGIGFTPANPGEPTRGTGGGNGVRNMNVRLDEIGGRCEIDSKPGKGTTLRFSVPLR